MKRDARLRALSSDHHRALVLARQVRERSFSGGAGSTLGRHVADRFAAELEPHFELEEELLLPALRAIGEIALVARTEADHAFLRAVAGAARAGEVADLETFAERLSEHVRFEERELFPCCESKLASEVLDEVARRSRRASRRPG
jgi:hemerythrin-like domain-containing protein